MTTGKALNGKPYAGNPHVRFDEGEVAPCTAEASLRRRPCRRQPEGCASRCAATPRRGSLLYKKLVVFAVAAAVCVAANGARAVEPFPDGARVVFFGDSITQNGVAVTWVAAHYRKMFPNSNVRMFNVGISGGSVGAAHLYFDSWLAPLKPTHVVVGFGVNDAGAAVFRKDAKDKSAELKRIESVAASFEKRYCSLLDRIEALGAKVILRTPTPYDEFSKGPTAAGKTRVNAWAGRNDAQRRMAESVRKIAAVRNLPLVDDFAAFSPYMNGEDVPFEADRVHPDKQGLWRLARNLLSAQGLEIEKFRSIDEVAEEVGLTAWRAASVRLSNLLSAEFLIVRNESLDLNAKFAKVRGWLAKNEKRKGANPYVVARARQFLEDKPCEAELRAEEEAAWGRSLASHRSANSKSSAAVPTVQNGKGDSEWCAKLSSAELAN